MIITYIIGVDIGTQGVKGALLNQEFEIVARAYIETYYLQPKPNWVEHDSEKVWWGGFKTIVKQLLRDIPREKISGIGCSGVSPCLLPMDKGDRPLRNAILYGIDTRSKDEVREMTARLGEDQVLELSRQPLSTQSIGPKLLWYQKNEPHNFDKTERIFTSSNYIVYKLTGNYVLDHSQASEYAPFYNYHKKDWDNRTISLYEMPLKLFPPLKNAYDIGGTITKEAAEETGLPEGIPVVVSTVDAFAELLSVGGVDKGEVVLIYGTTGIIALATDKMPLVKDLYVYPHPLHDNLYVVSGGMATTAALTKWFRDNFGELEKLMQGRLGVNAYELLSEQAAKVPPGSEGLMVLPYFSGERTPHNDPLARGVLMGLTTYHGRANIYRALLEGTAYGYKQHFDLFSEYGFEVQKVVACGGGSKSALWVQIVSDVTGYDQQLPNAPLGSEIGAAFLVAKAIGLQDDFSTIRTKLISRNGVNYVTANLKNHHVYQDYYAIYTRLYENIKDDMHALAQLVV
ncbi:MAG: FGGY-family carbohydrate kinase [Limnochordia bacterium]|jgi:xylulokinase